MRKDIKRSLVLWPGFVSATIILVSLLAASKNDVYMSMTTSIKVAWANWTGQEISLPEIENQNDWQPPHINIELNPAEIVANPNSNAESAERSEHGSRGLAMPHRVATVLSDNTVSLLSNDLMHGDVLAAERIADPEKIAAAEGIQIRSLQQVPLAKADDFSQPIEDNTAELENPEDLELIFPAGPLAESEIEDSVDHPVQIQLPTYDLPITLDANIVKQSIPEPPAEQPKTLLPQSVANLAKVVPRQEPVAESIDKIATPEPTVAKPEPAKIAHKVQAGPAAWPLTVKLNEQLAVLVSEEANPSDINGNAAASWASEVSGTLSELRTLQRLGDSRSEDLIIRLSNLAERGYTKASEDNIRSRQIAWLVSCHALARRVAIWHPVYQIVSGKEYVPSQNPKVDIHEIESLVAAVSSDLSTTGDANGWSSYLMLDEIKSAASGDTVNERAMVAQRFALRLQWHGLDQSSRTWLKRESVSELQRAISPWTRTAIDYAALLNQIERQEADAIDLAAIDIAGAAQTLRFAQNPAATRVADAINVFYRNANVRMAISESLMQRLMPPVDPETVPVRTSVLGSRVRGQSTIESRVKVALTPSPDRWMITLQTNGNVKTQSVGLKDKVSVSTRRDSNFAAATPVEITPFGATVGNSFINVSGTSRLNTLKTNYDGWPLFGLLVRSIAESEYHKKEGLTDRIANRKLKDQLASEIDTRLNERLSLRSSQLSELVMGPLSTLALEPKVIDMQTTDQRLIARYRLAGDWQIGAFTPRPRAPQNSLISLQVNQSALNNTLEQIVPLDSPTTIQDAIASTMKIFGKPSFEMPEDLPTDVMLQFTRTRPITVEMKDGKVWLTMRIVELSREKGAKLRRFIVRAAYTPQVDGLNAYLVRDGHLRISGPGMSMRQRLPIRAIFNKVLSTNRSIPLTADALGQHPALRNAAITQLELRDGWLAMAIADRSPERVAESNGTEGQSR